MEISDRLLLEYTSWARGVYKVMITMFVLQVHLGECEVVLPLSAHSNMCAQPEGYTYIITPIPRCAGLFRWLLE